MKACFFTEPDACQEPLGLARDRFAARQTVWLDAALRRSGPQFAVLDGTLPRAGRRRRLHARGGGGRDGSLHRAINALSQMKKMKTEVAVVPAGTCNDFARSLGLKRKKTEEAFRLACSGKAIATDLARHG